jgi:uncharacterized protein (DUF4415 family)
MNEEERDLEPEYDFSSARQGPVIPPGGGKKTRITIRLDADVVQWFRDEVHRRGGGSYQTLINDALREHVARQAYSWEEAVRRVVREELAAYRENDTVGG